MTDIPETELASVMRRVRKLLAIAQDTRGSMAEAKTAAGMAQRIMDKYKLEHQDLLMNELRHGDNFGTAEREVRPSFSRDGEYRWAGMLAVQIARSNDCCAEYHNGENLRFYGIKSDVEVASWMFDYLADQVQLVSRAFHVLTRDAARTRAFRQGMVTQIIQNMRNERLAVSGNALVVAKQAAVQEHFGRYMVTRPAKRSYDQHANAMGKQAGNNVDLNRRGVGGQSGSLRLS